MRFPYLHFPPLHIRTYVFRTCIFHPPVLSFSVLAISVVFICIITVNKCMNVKSLDLRTFPVYFIKSSMKILHYSRDSALMSNQHNQDNDSKQSVQRSLSHTHTHTHYTHTRTHTRLMALFPGLPGWAGTRNVKPIWILLKPETVSCSGISWDICKSALRSRPAPHHSVFYRPDALPATQPTVSKH